MTADPDKMRQNTGTGVGSAPPPGARLPATKVVAIGSTQSGLDAVLDLIRALSEKTGAAIVLAHRMSPDHAGMLLTRLSQITALAIVELRDPTPVLPDTIYIPAEPRDITLQKGLITPRQPDRDSPLQTPNIDRLFESLALEYGKNGLGVILSGDGSDGSYGIRALRDAGGITAVLDPDAAVEADMPRSAIRTGCVDLILGADALGAHVAKILTPNRNATTAQAPQVPTILMDDILDLLTARTGIDFGNYRKTTLTRRINRRMIALGMGDHGAYVDHCRAHEREVDALHRDLLISVTRFFRDKEPFAALESALTQMARQGQSQRLRIWVAGCATGEEAYSVAILVCEALGGLAKAAKHNVQIFATDIDRTALDIARRATYPASAARDIPQDHLDTYFIREGDEITVCPELRAMTSFAMHNVFQDPPFLNIDLVSLRNVLIYFNPALQEQVLARLHHALVPGGLLFLGNAEGLRALHPAFEPKGAGSKVFAKSETTGDLLTPVPAARPPALHNTHRAGHPGPGPQEPDTSHLALARAIAPTSVLATQDGTIVDVLGDLGPFSDAPAQHDELRSIRRLSEPWKSEAISLISGAIRAGRRRSDRWHPWPGEPGMQVQLAVYSFAPLPKGPALNLLAFHQSAAPQDPAPRASSTSAATSTDEFARMLLDMRATHDALRDTVDALQGANEELQTSNEELQTTNEEFQATNEELETSNEELQSANEQLLSVNEQLQISTAEKNELAVELEATMQSAPYAFALADRALVLRRMSNRARDLFGIAQLSPEGTHISECTLPPGCPALAPLANAVLRREEPAQLALQSEGLALTMTLSPVHDGRGTLLGLSIIVAPRDSAPLAQVLTMYEAVTGAAHWSYDIEADDLFWSKGMFDLFGRDPADGPPSWAGFTLLFHPDDRESDADLLGRIEESGRASRRTRRILEPDGRVRSVQSSVSVVNDAIEDAVRLVGVIWEPERASRA